MATVTSLTAERMLEIEAASVIDGEIISGNLILTTRGGTQINAGSAVGPAGPVGPVGPTSAIPGEIRLWPGTTLPDLATYGKWVWADGAYYLIDDYPKAAAHIASQWRTFSGASDPGPLNFRVPDLRGLVVSGMDAMPGGARANRMTRSVAIIIAARTGEETHIISMPEMPQHSHRADGGGGHGGMTVGTDRNLDHQHTAGGGEVWWSGAGFNQDAVAPGGKQVLGWNLTGLMDRSIDHLHAIYANGGSGAHENVQPTVFVPYMVKLD